MQLIKEKLIVPILNFLKQGTSPTELALAISIGIAIGTFPMLGVTTAIGALFAVLLRLNMAAIQIVNYFVYPLQLILFIPFIKIGGYIFKSPPFPYSMDKVFEMIQSDFLLTIKELWIANMFGIVAWAVIVIPLSMLTYLIFRNIFTRISLSYR
jgi:uncharacterized protein (DUF2062 family)